MTVTAYGPPVQVPTPARPERAGEELLGRSIDEWIEAFEAGEFRKPRAQ